MVYRLLQASGCLRIIPKPESPSSREQLVLSRKHAVRVPLELEDPSCASEARMV
jgi:hypothetical protein